MSRSATSPTPSPSWPAATPASERVRCSRASSCCGRSDCCRVDPEESVAREPAVAGAELVLELFADAALGPVGELAADQGHLDVELDLDGVQRAVPVRFYTSGGADLHRRTLGFDELPAGAGPVGMALPVVGGGDGVRGFHHPLGEPWQIDLD